MDIIRPSCVPLLLLKCAEDILLSVLFIHHTELRRVPREVFAVAGTSFLWLHPSRDLLQSTFSRNSASVLIRSLLCPWEYCDGEYIMQTSDSKGKEGMYLTGFWINLSVEEPLSIYLWTLAECPRHALGRGQEWLDHGPFMDCWPISDGPPSACPANCLDLCKESWTRKAFDVTQQGIFSILTSKCVLKFI